MPVGTTVVFPEQRYGAAPQLAGCPLKFCALLTAFTEVMLLEV